MTTNHIYPAGARPIIGHPGANVNDLRNLFAVYELTTMPTPEAPGAVIFASVCKLANLFNMQEARNNSEWSRMTNNGNAPLLVTIVAICPNQVAATTVLLAHMRTLPTWPHCNKHGYDIGRAARRLIASDGRIFANQADAAAALGVSTSAISQHIRGKIPAIKGLKLTYHHDNGEQ